MRHPTGLSAKFFGIVMLCFALTVAVSALSLGTLRESLMADRREKTREMVELATDVVTRYANLAAHGAMTEDAAKQAAAKEVGEIRYGGKNYFWINDMQEKIVVHPLHPEWVGTDASGQVDARGVHIYSEFVRIARTGGGYLSYWFPKLGQPDDLFYPKVSYVTAFAPWGWVIGTGSYVDDVYALFWSQVRRIGALIAGLAVCVGGASFLLARSVTRPVNSISAGDAATGGR